MISPELLSAIYGYDIVDVIIEGEDVWPLVFVRLSRGEMVKENAPCCRFKSVNIHSLAHKCKEWASKSNYSLVSYFSLQSKKWFCIVDIDDGFMFHSDIYQEYAGSEPESIFKACQWILDKKEKQ